MALEDFERFITFDDDNAKYEIQISENFKTILSLRNAS